MKPNPVREKSYAFALEIVRLCRELTAAREYVLARQTLRAGTSIGANVAEAIAGQSRRDFIAKMSIASKEARETHYWLSLLRDAGVVRRERCEDVLRRCDELVRILTAIVKSASTRN
jgi:four helix bundle protein